MGLYDAVLVKDNHIALAGGIEEAVRRALERRPEGMAVEVECGSLADVEARWPRARSACCSTTWTPRSCARRRRWSAGRAELEASGGITRQRSESVGATGVQLVSLGFLTHSAPALDLSMTVEPA